MPRCFLVPTYPTGSLPGFTGATEWFEFPDQDCVGPLLLKFHDRSTPLAVL